jgi:hypothetical protein
MHITAHFNQQNPYESPLLASLKILMQQYPKDKFTLFVEIELADLPKNCTQKILSPKPKNNFLLYFWYKFRLHSFLKLHKKIIFIGNAGLLCEQSTIPQYLFFNEANFWQDSNPVFKSKFEAALVLAKKIFVTENFLAEVLIEKYAVPKEKIEIIFHGLGGKIKQYDIKIIEEIKTVYVKGYDYYLYSVTSTSKEYILNVLKAFSQLKKMQKTAMKLVLFLDDVLEESLIPDFKNYKYRDEVIFLKQDVNNRRNIVSASNGLFYFSTYKTNSIAFVALQQAIPIVTVDNDINKSIFGNAALYTENTDKAITEKMQLLYKDEAIKNNLATVSNELLKKYDPTNVAAHLYNFVHVK